jgi:hypothetical protein
MPADEALPLLGEMRRTYTGINSDTVSAHNAKIERDLMVALYGQSPDWRPEYGDECVYVWEAVGLGGVYKVGRTANLPEREQDFATLPFKVKRITIAYTPDSRVLEGWCHKRFCQQRVNGEWFKLDAEQLKELLQTLRSK